MDFSQDTIKKQINELSDLKLRQILSYLLQKIDYLEKYLEEYADCLPSENSKADEDCSLKIFGGG